MSVRMGCSPIRTSDDKLAARLHHPLVETHPLMAKKACSNWISANPAPARSVCSASPPNSSAPVPGIG